MARTILSEISLLAILFFFVLAFGVMDKDVAFAGKWGDEFSSSIHSTDHPGPITGIFSAKRETSTKDSLQSIIVAFGVQAMSDDDDDDDGDDDDGDNDSDDDDNSDNDSDDDDDDENRSIVTTTNKESTTPISQQSTTSTSTQDSDDDDDDNDSDDDDDDGSSSSTSSTSTQDSDDDDDDNDDNDSDDDDDDGSSSSTSSTSTQDGDDDGDDDNDDNDSDDDDDDGSSSSTSPTSTQDSDDDDDDNDDNDSDDDDDDGSSSSTSSTSTPDSDDDDDDNDGDDDDNDNDDDDDDDDGRISNLVSSVRKGFLLKEVKANPALAKGVAGNIKRAGGARPLGSTPTTTSEETSSTTQSSYLSGGRASKTSSTTQSSYIFITSYLSADPVPKMSSTTQSSSLSGARVSDPSYFLAERDANGDVQFTFKRKTGSTVSTLSTTDPDVSSRRVDDLASGWSGVETHKDATNGIFNWDAYADSQGNADADYLSLGTWLFIYKDPEDGSFTGSYDLGVAAGGNDPFENENLAGLTGAATYSGPATGLYMMKTDADADPAFDYFDARADLAVDFGDATALGTLSGSITGGSTDGGVSLPALTLGSADITGAVLGGNFDGDTSGETVDGVTLSGKWGGKFFGNRASSTGHPGSVAGTFGANAADGLQSIIGAFGAKRTPSPVRYGSLLKEVNENPTLARGATVRILRAGGARPLGYTPASEEMSSTTQSSSLSGGRASDPSYFLAERDADGVLQFTFKRKTGSTVSTLSTTDQDVSSRRVDDLASGWKGVETHKDATNGIFNWDAYSDSQGNSDADYLSLGSWLYIYKDPEDESFTGSYALGVAAGGNDPFDNDNLAGLTGAASYRGPATGLHMMKADTNADPVFDYFDARANLSVDFGDATALGTVSGTITEGRTDGGVSLPALTLDSADITGSALGGNFDGDTSGVTGDGDALSGKWGGKFFGNRANSDDHPSSVAGAFGANTADNLQSIIGAFGAKRTP